MGKTLHYSNPKEYNNADAIKRIVERRRKSFLDKEASQGSEQKRKKSKKKGKNSFPRIQKPSTTNKNK